MRTDLSVSPFHSFSDVTVHSDFLELDTKLSLSSTFEQNLIIWVYIWKRLMTHIESSKMCNRLGCV